MSRPKQPRCGAPTRAGGICGRSAGHTGYHQAHWARSNEQERAYRSSVPGKASGLRRDAKNRANKKGIPFDLTHEWTIAELEAAVENGCPYLGIPIRLDCSIGDPHCPSIDQFVPGAGYTQDNCIIVSYKANAMKQDAPAWLVEKFGRNVARMARTRFKERNAA